MKTENSYSSDIHRKINRSRKVKRFPRLKLLTIKPVFLGIKMRYLQYFFIFSCSNDFNIIIENENILFYFHLPAKKSYVSYKRQKEISSVISLKKSFVVFSMTELDPYPILVHYYSLVSENKISKHSDYRPT